MLDINAFINHKTLKLMKHGGVRDVRLSSVYASNIDHANGWRASQSFHLTHLPIGCVCRKNDLTYFFVDWHIHKECFPFITRWVVFRHVECLKDIVISIDFGISDPCEANSLKNLSNFMHCMSDWMYMANVEINPRDGWVFG